LGEGSSSRQKGTKKNFQGNFSDPLQFEKGMFSLLGEGVWAEKFKRKEELEERMKGERKELAQREEKTYRVL